MEWFQCERDSDGQFKIICGSYGGVVFANIVHSGNTAIKIGIDGYIPTDSSDLTDLKYRPGNYRQLKPGESIPVVAKIQLSDGENEFYMYWRGRHLNGYEWETLTNRAASYQTYWKTNIRVGPCLYDIYVNDRLHPVHDNTIIIGKMDGGEVYDALDGLLFGEEISMKMQLTRVFEVFMQLVDNAKSTGKASFLQISANKGTSNRSIRPHKTRSRSFGFQDRDRRPPLKFGREMKFAIDRHKEPKLNRLSAGETNNLKFEGAGITFSRIKGATSLDPVYQQLQQRFMLVAKNALLEFILRARLRITFAYMLIVSVQHLWANGAMHCDAHGANVFLTRLIDIKTPEDLAAAKQRHIKNGDIIVIESGNISLADPQVTPEEVEIIKQSKLKYFIIRPEYVRFIDSTNMIFFEDLYPGLKQAYGEQWIEKHFSPCLSARHMADDIEELSAKVTIPVFGAEGPNTPEVAVSRYALWFASFLKELQSDPKIGEVWKTWLDNRSTWPFSPLSFLIGKGDKARDDDPLFMAWNYLFAFMRQYEGLVAATDSLYYRFAQFLLDGVYPKCAANIKKYILRQEQWDLFPLYYSDRTEYYERLKAEATDKGCIYASILRDTQALRVMMRTANYPFREHQPVFPEFPGITHTTWEENYGKNIPPMAYIPGKVPPIKFPVELKPRRSSRKASSRKRRKKSTSKTSSKKQRLF